MRFLVFPVLLFLVLGIVLWNYETWISYGPKVVRATITALLALAVVGVVMSGLVLFN